MGKPNAVAMYGDVVLSIVIFNYCHFYILPFLNIVILNYGSF